VPLFVEEVTRLLLERGEHGSGVKAIPPTLQQSLTARLDRLGPARAVVQIGAVIGGGFSYPLIRGVADMEDAPLQAALERAAEADILLVQGLPPESDYRFKHALIQDAAYESLLKSRRQVLHRRVAEALRDATAPVEPELLAHHFTQAGLIEAAIEWWGKAGQQSLERSALLEAVAQFTSALDQIAGLPATPALRREQITFQVSLANALMHVRGYAASESKSAIELARSYIERAEALGEAPEDPLLLFSVLYGVWAVHTAAYNPICRDLAAHFLALAERQGSTAAVLVGHRIMGQSLAFAGEFARARTHYDKGIALYDPTAHRQLATRFGQDTGVAILSYRSWTLWILGYPDAALRDAEDVLKDARETGQASSLMFALFLTEIVYALCGQYSVVSALAQELFALADQKGAPLWKAGGAIYQGCVLADGASEAVHIITSGISAWRSTGATVFLPMFMSHLAKAYVDLGQYDDSWRCIGEAMTAMESTEWRSWEAEIHRMAGEIALMSPNLDLAKAQAHFERTLEVARAQQAKSWELRAAMSMARLLRDQGKRDEAHDVLAPIYGWFTEGFDTQDLKDAKTLLQELA
jgi:predicted ATPase